MVALVISAVAPNSCGNSVIVKTAVGPMLIVAPAKQLEPKDLQKMMAVKATIAAAGRSTGRT